MFLRHIYLVPLPSVDIQENFTKGTPPSGGRGVTVLEKLSARGVAEYSDFRPIEGYILETVQDRR